MSAGAAGAFPSPPTAIPTTPAAGTSQGLGMAGGVIGGATGAILATVLWYAVVTATHIQSGIVAVAVGWIIGQAVVLGAGRATISLVPVSVALTLVALVVSQYLITVQFINNILVDSQAGYQIPFLASPIDALSIVGDWIQYDPLTLLFWAIALFEAVVIPWRRATRPSTPRWGGRPGAAPVVMSGPMMSPVAAPGPDGGSAAVPASPPVSADPGPSHASSGSSS
jgi:hypothetical protein